MMNWSQNQLDVINANDDRILVSASAGSGKTTVMIQRILRLLRDGAKISNMLICTFTKASAADMRAKLYQEMSKSGLRSELKDLSRADISTIDSFCQRIVTKYFYIVGVDPAFEVLDNGESKMLKSSAAEQAIERFKADGDFNELVGILSKRANNWAIKTAILDIMEFNSSNPQPSQYSYDHNVASSVDEYVQHKRQKTLDAIDALFSVAKDDEAKADVLALMETGIKSGKKNLFMDYEAYKPCFAYLKEKASDYAKIKRAAEALKPQSQSEHFINALLRAAKYATEVYTAEKRKRAAVDFADLESMTHEILKSQAADEIRAKYKYVFVDEYQDINPLQETLIQLVAQGNKLFMVGDLKQSIYAFRGCAPYIFKQKYDAYKRGDGGRVINLDTNYRSAKNIIRFVNDVFSPLMTEEFGGIDYQSNPMIAHKDNEGYVKFHIVTGTQSSDVSGVYSVKEMTEPPMSRMEAEATLVAYRIKELLKKTVDDRPVAFSDIAILSRAMGKLEELIVQKLRQINVPVSLAETAKYLERAETGQLISYLRLIDNRQDDMAMAISMLSPFGNFSENELAQIRLGGKGAFYQCVMDCKASNPKVKQFLDKLDRYYAFSLTHSVDELADLIVSQNGYFNYAFRLGEDCAEVLDKFLEFLSACPYKSSLRACIKFIDEQNPEAELSGDENSVRLLTVHKSKGLEFKYVFLVGLEESFNQKDLTTQIFVDKEVAMPVYQDHVAYNSDLRFTSVLREKKKSLEEELRILYVALTRAQEGLEIFGALSKNDQLVSAYFAQPQKGIVDLTECNSSLKWLVPQMQFAKYYDLSEVTIEQAPPRKVLFGSADAQEVQLLKEYFDFSPTVCAPAKSYASKLAHKDDEPVVYIVNDETSPDALERGNAYHRAMEVIDFASPDLAKVDEADLAFIDQRKLLVAAKKMLTFGGDAYKEKPFMLKLSAKEAGLDGEGSVLVQGVIDLLVINGDEAVVVDYKTGKAHGGYEQGYFKQVNIYALAVERLLKKKVVGKYLYYFDSEEFVEIR